MQAVRAPIVVLALALTPGCAEFAKNLKRQTSEWGDEVPPPPAVTTGPAAEAFAPLTDSDRLASWMDEKSGTPVIPKGGELLQAFPLVADWDMSRGEDGSILGRVGYMAVVYRAGDGCVWVRGRYYETHLGAGTFGALDVAAFNRYSFNTNLPEPITDEKRHRFACPQ